MSFTIHARQYLVATYNLEAVVTWGGKQYSQELVFTVAK
jgi:hypothetical protein